jgi:hypothetical protein
VRTLRIWLVTAVATALLGLPAGLLWAEITPPARYVVLDGKPVLADLETEALIGVDGRFAVIAAVAGVLCGVVAYAVGGRSRDIALVLGLAVGGAAAGLLAWRAGHQMGLETFQRLVRSSPDGRTVTGVVDLRAFGILVFWPLLAVVTFGMLEAADAAGRTRRAVWPGDAGSLPPGEPYQVAGGEFDLQASPTSRDVHRGEPGR